MDDATEESSTIGGGALHDLAANLLAVVILLTVLALLAAPPLDLPTTLPSQTEAEGLDFRTQPRTPFRPLPHYIVVAQGRLAPWDQTPVLEAISASGGGAVFSGRTEQGTFEFLPAAWNRHDVNAFRFRWHPAASWIAGFPAFDPATAEQVVADLAARYRRMGTAPTFLVYPDGMDAFAVLHRRLWTAAFPWRWVLLPENSVVSLVRTPQDHTRLTTYW